MTPETEQFISDKMTEARFGIEAETFLSSPLGVYLQKRVDDEVVEAINGLKSVDPADYQQIVKLQNSIYRAESFTAWVGELITNGWEAEKEIRLLEGRL